MQLIWLCLLPAVAVLLLWGLLSKNKGTPMLWIARGFGLCFLSLLVCAFLGDRLQDYDIRFLFSDEGFITINEVCTDNNAVLVDGATENCDYVEIYNASMEDYSIAGWYLSDDPDHPLSERLTSTVVPAQGYVLIYLGGTADIRAESVDISLSKDGDYLSLCDLSGNVVDSVEIPALGEDQCYARVKDGGSKWSVCYSSPLLDNSTASEIFDETLSAPEFSVSGGFYSESFTLTLSIPYAGSIYYTDNGETPNLFSTKYNGAITIEASDSPSDATVIRAIAYNLRKTAQSSVATETYLVFTDDAGIFTDGVYTLSLTTDAANLYGYETGIFIEGVTYDRAVEEKGEEVSPFFDENWWQDWERSAYVSVFDPNGDEVLSQNVTMKTHGNTSLSKLAKSFNLYAEDGQTLAYDFFGFGEDTSIVVRNGASDSTTYIRDGFTQSLCTDRAVETQEYLLCAVYINGHFYGAMTLGEKYSQEYFAKVSGAAAEDITILKNGNLTHGSEKAAAEWNDLMEYASTHDLSDPDAYEYVCSQLDIDSFIDLVCINRYIGNWDSYPRNNTYWWKVEGGKWQLCLQDLDLAAGNIGDLREILEGGDEETDNPPEDTENDEPVEDATDDSSFVTSEDAIWTAEIDPFTVSVDITLWDSDLFSALIRNDTFRQKFVTAFLDIAQVNFDPDTVAERLSAVVEDFLPLWQYATGRDADEGTDAFAGITGYYEARFAYVTEYLKENFYLKGTLAPVTLESSENTGGSISLNTTTPDLSGGAKTYYYYTDYPVSLTAVPDEGYTFVCWLETGETDETIEVSFTSAGVTRTAVFAPAE